MLLAQDSGPSPGWVLGKIDCRKPCEWATASGFSMLTLTTFRAVLWNMPTFFARLGFVEIPRDVLRPELAAVVSDEAARGLATRVVMTYRCSQTHRRRGTPCGQRLVFEPQ